jgi:hypothetical protein
VPNCGYFSDEVESSLMETLQRSAISNVVSQAPGNSSNSARRAHVCASRRSIASSWQRGERAAVERRRWVLGE